MSVGSRRSGWRAEYDTAKQQLADRGTQPRRSGAPKPLGAGTDKAPGAALASDLGRSVEPPVGIEPTTYSSRMWASVLRLEPTRNAA